MSSSEQIQPTRPEGKPRLGPEEDAPPLRPFGPGRNEGGSALFALLFVPIIIAYTSWCFYVMRGKVSADEIAKNTHGY